MSGLYSPILEQAGFLKRKAAAVVVETKLLTDEFISVICTGDSIADLGSSENAFLYSINTKGWPANTFGQSKQLFNMLPDSGIAGNTTQMLLDRLQTDVIDTGAQVAVIMIGTNDVHAQIAESVTIANMQTIVDNITNAGMKVIITPITWRGDNHPIYTGRIETINAAYADIANTNPNVAISGTFDEFNEIAIDSFRWREVTLDKLHPNSAGAYLMGSVISKAIDDNLESTYPSSAINLTNNKDLTGTSGNLYIGATGQAPSGWNVYYAQPEFGVGSSYNLDGLNLRVGDGISTPRNDGKVSQVHTISSTGSNDFIAVADVSITKQMLSEIKSLAISINPNSGKTTNFLLNGEDVNAVFKYDYDHFIMRTLPTKLLDATSAEVYLTLVSRGNQDVEIKIHELSLVKI